MKKKILTILGDFYHSHDLAYTAIVKAAENLQSSSGTEIELIDSSVQNLGEMLNQKFDLIVLYKENRINPADEVVYNWMTPELEQQITLFVKNGGSLFAWHSGIVSYEGNQLFADMLRGCFEYHPSEREVKYTGVNNIIGILPKESFEVLDEHYMVKANPIENSVFLTSRSTEGEVEAGWAHEYGNGRVCCLTPTHRAEGMTNNVMLDLLSQCVSWCLKS